MSLVSSRRPSVSLGHSLTVVPIYLEVQSKNYLRMMTETERNALVTGFMPAVSYSEREEDVQSGDHDAGWCDEAKGVQIHQVSVGPLHQGRCGLALPLAVLMDMYLSITE